MSASTDKARPSGAFIPSDLLLDDALHTSDKVIYAVITQAGREIAQGLYFVKSGRLSGFAGVSLKTVQRSLERLRDFGWIELKQKEGYKGGYLVRFSKASAVALMLSVLSFAGAQAGLHIQNYQKNAQGCDMRGNRSQPPQGYGLYDKPGAKRKSKRKKPALASGPTPPSSFLNRYDQAGPRPLLQMDA